jgi:cytochrome c oxidase assembly factor CtaG
MPLTFLLAGLMVRWVIWPDEVIRREPFESALWYWVLPSMVVALFFFVIEEKLRHRDRQPDAGD